MMHRHEMPTVGGKSAKMMATMMATRKKMPPMPQDGGQKRPGKGK